MELHIGTTVNRYQVEGLLAEGGMSLVYLVRDLEQGTQHALKILTHHTRTIRKRLEQEGRAQRLLQHPNIVTVTGVIRVGHAPALIMDYVAGPDLADLLSRCRLSDAQVIQIALGIFHGTTAAHANGMVHRDLKPSNILLEIEEDRLVPRIADFGLAKVWQADDKRPMTHSGVVMGTPSYMAPEQIWDASTVDARADVFSIGTILYEALSGKRAFEGSHNIEVWSKITSGIYIPLHSLRPDLPREVIEVVRRAMATDIGQRTPSIEALLGEWARAWASTLKTASGPAESWRGETLQTAQSLSEERTVRARRSQSLGGAHDEMTTTIMPFLLGSDLTESCTVPGWSEPTWSRDDATAKISLPPTNLPPQVDRFVGRSAELATLKKHLEGTQPILTLSGPGGMGKTRLSLVFGEQNLSRFSGGVWFCDLTPARSAEDILRIVAQSLAVPLSKKNPAVQLAYAIHGRGEVLIILDNMEQVVEFAPETVGMWTQQAPSARFLITSRIKLGLQSEQVMVLDPLDTEDGIVLFSERARNLNQGFTLSKEDREVVGQIITHLDGMSLAIELAAARSMMLSPSQILERLDHRFQLLSHGRRDQTARQATLRGAIDWSWDLLQPVERAALAQCSIFRGGFTLDAAEEILDLEPWGGWPMDVVQRLVEQSLVRTTEPIPGEVRFQIYESIREYAQEKMGAQDAVVTPADQSHTGPAAWRALGVRHTVFYSAMGEPGTVRDQFWGGTPEVRQSFCMESDNLAQAISLSQTNPNTAIQARATVAWATIRLWHGPYASALQVTTGVLEREDLDPRSRLQLCEIVGDLHVIIGQRSLAVPTAQECLELARLLKDRGAEGRALRQRTIAMHNELDTAENLAFYKEALIMVQETEDWRTEVEILLSMATVHADISKTENGMQRIEEALSKSQDGGCLILETSALRSRAVYHIDTGTLDLAEKDLKHARDNAQRLGQKSLLSSVLSALGTLYKDQGRLEESVEVLELGIQLCREIGDARGECIQKGNLALNLQLHGKPDEARALYEDTVRLAQAISAHRVKNAALGNLGDLLLRQGLLEESRLHLEEAILALDNLLPTFAGAFRGSLAFVLAQIGEIDEARACVKRGKEQLKGIWVVERGRMLCREAQVEHLAGCHEDAKKALQEAREIAQQIGGSPDSDLGQLICEAAATLEY